MIDLGNYLKAAKFQLAFHYGVSAIMDLVNDLFVLEKIINTREPFERFGSKYVRTGFGNTLYHAYFVMCSHLEC